jgi:5-methylcytosine-specific restriction endonuclease McrA
MVRFTKEDKKAIAKAQKQEVYEGNYWGELRLVGYRCKKCRRVFPLDILEVDHIKPRALRGSDRPSNLQLLCPPCNKKKGPKLSATGVKTSAKSVKKATSKKSKTVSKKTTKSSVKRKSTSTKSKTTKKRK